MIEDMTVRKTPGAASRKRTTSSGLRTTGIFRGSATYVR
jgi:hypothetical protein